MLSKAKALALLHATLNESFFCVCMDDVGLIGAAFCFSSLEVHKVKRLEFENSKKSYTRWYEFLRCSMLA